MNRKRKLIISLLILVILLWVSMVITDYIRSTKALYPIFAQSINASDADVFRGIGYKIIIDDGYAVSPQNAVPKGYFYWDW